MIGQIVRGIYAASKYEDGQPFQEESEMDIEKLFSAMDAAGIGCPKDKSSFGMYAPWGPIYRAYLQGKPESSILGQIPFVAQAMGRILARTKAILANWAEKAARLDAAKNERKTGGNDLVTGMAFGFDSEAGQ